VAAFVSLRGNGDLEGHLSIAADIGGQVGRQWTVSEGNRARIDQHSRPTTRELAAVITSRDYIAYIHLGSHGRGCFGDGGAIDGSAVF
jgi:hypothetical protein